MKPSRLSIGSKVTFLLLAMMLALSPITVQAQPLSLNGVGSESGGDISIQQISSGETVVSSKPSGPITPTMTISQTLSDEAQRNTIAFDGLAFLTGDMACNTFLPPGKVADFCVIDGDILTIDPHKIADLRILMTVSGGNIVYDTGSL